MGRGITMAVQELLLLPVGTLGVNDCNGDLLMLGTTSGWDGSADPISTAMIGQLPRVLFLMTLLLLVNPWCPPRDCIHGWQLQLR